MKLIRAPIIRRRRNAFGRTAMSDAERGPMNIDALYQQAAIYRNAQQSAYEAIGAIDDHIDADSIAFMFGVLCEAYRNAAMEQSKSIRWYYRLTQGEPWQRDAEVAFLKRVLTRAAAEGITGAELANMGLPECFFTGLMEKLGTL
jgi:hypothetical protein